MERMKERDVDEGEVLQPAAAISDEEIRWIKNGGGTFRMGNGKIIKPGQTFRASVAQIPKGFRDIIVPLDALPKEPPLEVKPSSYELRARAGGGFYDIVDGLGKVLNEKALRRTEAEHLLKDLNG